MASFAIRKVQKQHTSLHKLPKVPCNSALGGKWGFIILLFIFHGPDDVVNLIIVLVFQKGIFYM